jgi:membrane-associated phospholipid phosphatase
MIPNVAYAGTMLISSLLSGSTEMRSRGNLMFRASAYAQLTTTALKFIIRQPRPDGSGEKVSFPSGHTTAAFSFASVIHAEHGWYYGALAYTYATLVAYGRMNDNRHLLHDVVAGATVGMSFGLGLYYRQLDPKKENQPQVTLLPAPDLSGGVVSANLSF